MKKTSGIIALLALACSAALHAHTKISATVPADGAEVAAPTEIRLEFSAPVKLTAIGVKDASGEGVAVGRIPSDVARTISVSIDEALQPGRHTVTWRSISGDSHIVSGDFGFTVTR